MTINPIDILKSCSIVKLLVIEPSVKTLLVITDKWRIEAKCKWRLLKDGVYVCGYFDIGGSLLQFSPPPSFYNELDKLKFLNIVEVRPQSKKWPHDPTFVFENGYCLELFSVSNEQLEVIVISI